VTQLEVIGTLDHLQRIAKSLLPRDIVDFIDGGAGAEHTLRANERDFQDLIILPRVLRDVAQVDLSTTVLGTRIDLPVLVAPSGSHRLAHPEGELATARGAARTGTCYVISTSSSYPMEEIAAASHGPKWFQLYCYRDRAITRSLIERANVLEFQALCVTVDTPRVGRKDRDLRNKFRFPEHVRWRNFDDSELEVAPAGDVAAYIASQWDPSVTWHDIEWIRSLTDLPIVLKGILHPDDAELAVGSGVAGVIVSNHGSRNLDGVSSSIRALGAIVERVDGRVEVYCDGGIRRGTDVFKALSLGARAVLIGRPCFWGLAVSGADGVARCFEILRDELYAAMTLAGITRVSEIDDRATSWRRY